MAESLACPPSGCEVIGENPPGVRRRLAFPFLWMRQETDFSCHIRCRHVNCAEHVPNLNPLTGIWEPSYICEKFLSGTLNNITTTKNYKQSVVSRYVKRGMTGRSYRCTGGFGSQDNLQAVLFVYDK